ncbi:MAG TPA: pantoate--beta-alanine ligase [Candidatus Ratteibacteria bacterium]|nr:pantoate--beta-alanine ligase [Candidatus Ratteibacteria bacterium]
MKKGKMEIFKKKEKIGEKIREIKKTGKKIGFVATMGYLHNGHISLISKAREENDIVIVSIFVNPTQFGPGEDFERYPRNVNRDIELLEKEKVDIVFIPNADEMYKKGHKAWVNVEEYSEILEGKLRKGHFRGVCTVVAKLFNIIQPDRSYFGWKDAQQLIIIKKMVDDLDIPVEIVGCPTLREKSGLAESSRNIYLTEEEKQKALCLYKVLKKIKEMAKKGEKNTKKLIEEGKKIILSTGGVELQYLEIVNIENLQPVEKIDNNTIVLGAIKIGNVHLIDNIFL